jgi:hypothetical protein
MNLNFTQNRFLIFISGFALFLAVCFTFSFEWEALYQSSSGAMYFFAGILLYKIKAHRWNIVILFSPFLLLIIISLFSNPGLFPAIVPILIVNCIVNFILGAIFIEEVKKKRARRMVIIVLTTIIISVTVVQVVIRINYDKIVEAKLPPLHRTQLSFLGNQNDTVTVNTDDITVLDFWFIRCSACYDNNDFLNSLALDYSKLGVKFYLINIGSIDSVEKFNEFNNDYRWKNLIHVYDPKGELFKSMGLEGAPHTLIVSRGKVIHHQSGFGSATMSLEEKDFRKIIFKELNSANDSLTITSGTKNIFDIGRVNLRDTATIRYKIRNPFTEPLSLEEIRPSCDCLVTDWTKKEIAPAAFGYVHVKLVPTQLGKQAQLFVIETNSKEQPFTTVEILLEVI